MTKVGTTTADEFSVGLSVTAEAGIEGIAKVSSTLSTEFRHSISVTNEEEREFSRSFNATNEDPEIFFCSWQGIFKYEVDYRDSIIYTRYPEYDWVPAKRHSGAIYAQQMFLPILLELYEMTNRNELYDVSQYPPLRRS